MSTRSLLFTLIFGIIAHMSIGQNCVTFDAIGIGTPFGDPVNTIGEQIFIENDIPVFVEYFFWTNGSGTFNTGEVVLPFSGFGTGHIMNLNNLNLRFMFDALSHPVKRVTFDFADLGGNENLGISGQPPFIGELTMAIPPAGYSITVSTTTISGGVKGQVTIEGDAISEIMVGGQEFFLDNICAFTLTGTNVQDRVVQLDQNYPNPFIATTRIPFQLLTSGNVEIRILNNLGIEIRTITDALYAKGNHFVEWDGLDQYGNRVASGIYFYQMQTETTTLIKKMNLIR